VKNRYVHIINGETVKKTCEVFSKLTGLILDVNAIDGSQATRHYASDLENPFCRTIKKDPKILKICTQSCKEAINNSLAKNALEIYKCPFGLTEITIPIKIDNEFLCSFTTGQFFLAEKSADKIKYDYSIPAYTQ